MRQFQIVENKQGKDTWSIGEVIDGRMVLLGQVRHWQAEGPIEATPVGIIKLEAGDVSIDGGAAVFS